MKDKRGFVDMEVVTSIGFVILVAMSVGATILGYVMSKRMDYTPMATWQLLVVILVEIVACYFFIERSM